MKEERSEMSEDSRLTKKLAAMSDKAAESLRSDLDKAKGSDSWYSKLKVKWYQFGERQKAAGDEAKKRGDRAREEVRKMREELQSDDDK